MRCPTPARHRRLPPRLLLLCCLIHLVMPSGLNILCFAEGFRNPPPGAFNLGRAGGRIAQIDDASAVTQNPANLVDLSDMEVQIAPSIVYIHVSYDSPAGLSSETRDPWKLLPNFFASIPLIQNKVAAGIGVTTPFGLSNEWETDGAFGSPAGLRYLSPHFAELKTINLNPAVSVRLTDSLTLGAGLDVFWSQLTFKQFYPWVLFPGGAGADPDGNAKAKGDGFGFGGNAGLTWQITDRQRFAVTYRSPVTVDYEGHLQISDIPARAAAAGIAPRSHFDTSIEFPTILGVGYGFQLTKTIRLELDGEWLQFSNFKTLNLDLGKNAVLFPSTVIREDWNDTFTIGLGGDWQFAPGWTWRAGYQFYESPVPDKTFTPTIPDANQHVFTTGFQYRTGHHSVEAAYGGIFYDDRHIENDIVPAFNGDYQIVVHLFSLAYGYRF